MYGRLMHSALLRARLRQQGIEYFLFLVPQRFTLGLALFPHLRRYTGEGLGHMSNSKKR